MGGPLRGSPGRDNPTGRLAEQTPPLPPFRAKEGKKGRAPAVTGRAPRYASTNQRSRIAGHLGHGPALIGL